MQWISIIRSAVNDLDAFLKDGSWQGRENEVINLFAHRFLASSVSPSGPLRSLRQIGIEVAVRQIGCTGKKYVRKDLVIWPTEDMTVWQGAGHPAVIVEWKRNDLAACRQDAVWLAQFCATYPETLGVSVCAMLQNPNRGCQIISVTGHPVNSQPPQLRSLDPPG